MAAIPVMAKPSIFTWAWCRQRALFWVPFALVFGVGVGVWYATCMNAWRDFPMLGLVATVVCIVAVITGRLGACLVRQYNLPRPVELLLVVAAILVGTLVSYVAFRFLDYYHWLVMGVFIKTRMFVPHRSVNETVAYVLRAAPNWIILFLISGGYDLPAYLSEQRRLLEAARQREVLMLRTEKIEADMQLAILQAQIEPHFLFNTLASVRSIVLSEPDRAIATIDALSDYLRSTLPRLRNNMAMEMPTLGAQIEICKNYLELMKIRMGGRLNFEIDVPREASAAAFPPLLLLPLVENAVKHGIEPKPGSALVCIRAVLNEGNLKVTVEDDGLGLRAETGSGLGLANVQSQLRNYFDNRASLNVASGRSGGVCSTIAVPAPAQ